MIRLALIIFLFSPPARLGRPLMFDAEAAPKKHGISELIYIGKAVAQNVTIHGN